MMKKFIILLVITIPTQLAWSQKQPTKADTIIVEVGKNSRVVLTVGDTADLALLKKYNFQKLFEDALKKIEQDTLPRVAETTDQYSLIPKDEQERTEEYDPWSEDWDDDDDDNDNTWEYHGSRNYRKRTTHSMNFEFGMNNWLQDGKFPDTDNELYSVKPWGSWYVGFNSIQRTRMSKKFFLEWGGGISWYNLKFQDASARIVKGDDALLFYQDSISNRSYIKSKIAATFLNASLIPVLDFGGHGKKARFWDGNRESFRVGLGPYVGYRIDSWTKAKYEEDGDKQKDKYKSNYYINNFRYGVRLQLGFRSTDFFVNYDLNEFFAAGRGPKLNAFSFGIIL